MLNFGSHTTRFCNLLMLISLRRKLYVLLCFLLTHSTIAFLTESLRFSKRYGLPSLDGKFGLPRYQNLDLLGENLSLRSSTDNEEGSAVTIGLATSGLYGMVGFLYWYWLVLGALVVSVGLPGVPSFIPMSPGWPPSPQDLQPVLEDSSHFFYLADLLQKPDLPDVQPLRLALFNIAEAWIFAFLPALWKDRRRLPRPILLILWLVLGINLTNAFLAPYLFVTERMEDTPPPSTEKDARLNPIMVVIFGMISASVMSWAAFQAFTQSTTENFEEILALVRSDRSYLAFVVDLSLFSIFQPFILRRARGNDAIESWDCVPIVGLLSWMREEAFADRGLTSEYPRE